MIRRVNYIVLVLAWALFGRTGAAWAIQLHQSSEGIVVHQVGHVFFLLSMVALIFIISVRGLNREKGWNMIQWSAIFFAIWNLDTILAHFLDNQVGAVFIDHLSLMEMKITAASGSDFLPILYHGLKLDHLFCVPAIFLFYRGLANILVRETYKRRREKERTL